LAAVTGFLSAARSSWINLAALFVPTIIVTASRATTCSFLEELGTSVSWHVWSIRRCSSAPLCLRRYPSRTGRSRIKAVTAVTAMIGIIERSLGGPDLLRFSLQAGDAARMGDSPRRDHRDRLHRHRPHHRRLPEPHRLSPDLPSPFRRRGDRILPTGPMGAAGADRAV